MRSSEEARKQLKIYTDIICSEHSSFLEIRETLFCIHNLFVEMGAINVDVQEVSEKPRWLDNGCAISPIAAGRCLFEIVRTREFILGIREAIRQLLASDTQQPLHILDAGCGPYALLSLLPALYTKPGSVVFHILDIFGENLASAKTLIQNLGMEDHFGDYIQEDACTFQWQRKEPLHLLIVEVMLQALRKEPQVAVTLNLSPQLVPGGILIPQEVDVNFVIVEKGNRWKEVETVEGTMLIDRGEEGEEILAHLITLSKNTAQHTMLAPELARVPLPDYFNSAQYDLQLHTHIKVYGGHILKRNDTSLTLPQTILRKEKVNMGPGTSLSFRYETLNDPGIMCTILSNSVIAGDEKAVR
jgi:hypothetical protein